MDHKNNSDPQKSDNSKEEEDIIELTEIVEIKPQQSLEKDINPDDFSDDEGFDLSDELDMAELDPEDYPDDFDYPEPSEDLLQEDGFSIDEPEVDEIDDLNAEISDLGMLVSQITGSPLDPDSKMSSAPVPELGNITTAQLDKAVEKAVDKIFKEKIEAKVMALFEAVVKKEIDKITDLIKEEAKKE